MPKESANRKTESGQNTLEQVRRQLEQTERLLRESESRFRGTLDNILEGCQIIGFDWRYLYINDAAARHGHKTKDESSTTGIAGGMRMAPQRGL